MYRNDLSNPIIFDLATYIAGRSHNYNDKIKMTTVQDTSNEIPQKDSLDEQTKLLLKSFLEEIDRKWQTSSNQSTASDVRIKYIKFTSDKERKILSFTGKVNKVEIPAKDFETGRDIPDNT